MSKPKWFSRVVFNKIRTQEYPEVNKFLLNYKNFMLHKLKRVIKFSKAAVFLASVLNGKRPICFCHCYWYDFGSHFFKFPICSLR